MLVPHSQAVPSATKWRQVVLLGHGGFIGQHLMKVWAEGVPGVPLTGLSSANLDLSQTASADKLAAMLDPQTLVIMLAGLKRQMGDTLETFARNQAIMLHLCLALRRQAVGRLVFLSSAAVYGEEYDNLAITEATPTRPTSLYGLSKLQGEELLRLTLAGQAGSLLVLRPPLIYGPGDRTLGYGPSGFAAAAARRQPCPLWGDGSELRDFLFVEDAARLLVHLALSDATGVVNLVRGESHSYQEVLALLRLLAPAWDPGPGRARSRPQVNHQFDADRLCHLAPGWRYTSLAASLHQTYHAAAQAVTL